VLFLSKAVDIVDVNVKASRPSEFTLKEHGILSTTIVVE
jgi:hypothetical protein